MRQSFIDYCTDNDRWLQFKQENLTITGQNNDRVLPQQIADEFTRITNIQISRETALSEGKRIGLNYERSLRINDMSLRSKGIGESPRGVFVGVQIKSHPKRDVTDPNVQQ